MAVELVEHFFRRGAAGFEDPFQRLKVPALVAAELIDAAAPPQAGIAGAQSRGDTHNAETLTRALEMLQGLQGTPSGVDLVA